MTASAERRMRAYVHDGKGGAALADVPVPEPGPGEVRIAVRGCALNHLDLFVRQGMTGPGLRDHRYPHVSGGDVAGEVEALGKGITGVEVGDRVIVYPGLSCGTCEYCHRGEISMCRSYRILGEQVWGGLAECCVVPAGNLLRVPATFDLRAGAAAPVAFTTGWRLIVSSGHVRVGETVLVVGVGGGVASAAMQIAALAGAEVYVTSGEDWKIERARELGAVGGVNHRQRPFDEWAMEVTRGRGFDVVVDSTGQATWRSSIRSLSMGGRLCVCGATSGDRPDISIRELYQSHRQIVGAALGGRPDFDVAMGLVLSGRLRPVVHAAYPLERVAEAFDELDAGKQFGKIVIEPGPTQGAARGSER
jgi:NADPH:quinone reductase-like Zn-dependent oxidoreductase